MVALIKSRSLRRRQRAIVAALTIAAGYGPTSVDSENSSMYRDLFHGAAVTRADIDRWIAAIAGLTPGTWRAQWYERAYRVAEKVKAAKARGDFERTLAACERDRGITSDVS